MSDTKTIKNGDKFTIDGCGKSPRGHVVLNGKSVKTGRKMRVKTLFKFRCEFSELEKRIESDYNTDSPL